jgi:acid phosphatase (class A)
MKRSIYFLAFGLLASLASGQSKQLPKFPLGPARGHYKQLQAFSPAPAGANLEIDQLRFPYDAEAADRRMSLKPYFLKETQEFDMPVMPANSSEQTRAELNYLMALQNQRTEEQERAALYMADVFFNLRLKHTDPGFETSRKNLFHIGRSMGTWFNPDNLPVTAEFMARVWQDASYFTWKYKYHFLRVRPYVLEPALDNLEKTNWAAYPSGHAANSYVNALVYSAIAPEFADVLMKDAYDMAHSREIIGVHYPSDSEASRVLAYQLVNALFKNEKFLKELELVRAEWKQRGSETFIRPDKVERKVKAAGEKVCE